MYSHSNLCHAALYAICYRQGVRPIIQEGILSGSASAAAAVAAQLQRRYCLSSCQLLLLCLLCQQREKAAHLLVLTNK